VVEKVPIRVTTRRVRQAAARSVDHRPERPAYLIPERLSSDQPLTELVVPPPPAAAIGRTFSSAAAGLQNNVSAPGFISSVAES
jgi:hypothetical protein